LLLRRLEALRGPGVDSIAQHGVRRWPCCWFWLAGFLVGYGLAAASGLIIVALQIACLPTLYAACNRRETVVALLGPLTASLESRSRDNPPVLHDRSLAVG
jgi:hypothetical protein